MMIINNTIDDDNDDDDNDDDDDDDFVWVKLVYILVTSSLYDTHLVLLSVKCIHNIRMIIIIRLS